jgi:hypothetical protein
MPGVVEREVVPGSMNSGEDFAERPAGPVRLIPRTCEVQARHRSGLPQREDSKRLFKDNPAGSKAPSAERFNKRDSLRPEPAVIRRSSSLAGGRGRLTRGACGEEEWSVAMSVRVFPLCIPDGGILYRVAVLFRADAESHTQTDGYNCAFTCPTSRSSPFRAFPREVFPPPAASGESKSSADTFNIVHVLHNRDMRPVVFEVGDPVGVALDVQHRPQTAGFRRETRPADTRETINVCSLIHRSPPSS